MHGETPLVLLEKLVKDLMCASPGQMPKIQH
jgi:hypothetical protein